MGEKENKPFQLSFNGLLKVDFQGSRVTSDGGLILIRELFRRSSNNYFGAGRRTPSTTVSSLQRDAVAKQL